MPNIRIDDSLQTEVGDQLLKEVHFLFRVRRTGSVLASDAAATFDRGKPAADEKLAAEVRELMERVGHDCYFRRESVDG